MLEDIAHISINPKGVFLPLLLTTKFSQTLNYKNMKDLMYITKGQFKLLQRSQKLLEQLVNEYSNEDKDLSDRTCNIWELLEIVRVHVKYLNSGRNFENSDLGSIYLVINPYTIKAYNDKEYNKVDLNDFKRITFATEQEKRNLINTITFCFSQNEDDVNWLVLDETEFNELINNTLTIK